MSNENNPAELTILISEFLDKIIPAEGVGTVREQQRMRLHKEIFHLISPSPVAPKTLEGCDDNSMPTSLVRKVNGYDILIDQYSDTPDELIVDVSRNLKQVIPASNIPTLEAISVLLDTIEVKHPSVSEWRDVSKGELPEETAEYILCAAIWFQDGKTHEHQPKNVNNGFVVCGRRHHNCYITVACVRGEDVKRSIFPKEIQGFITNLDRFVDRKEAADIARESKQITSPTKGLFSEDLY